MSDDLLPTMKRHLADAEGDASRLRAAIAVLESPRSRAANGRSQAAKTRAIGDLSRLLDGERKSSAELAQEARIPQNRIVVSAQALGG